MWKKSIGKDIKALMQKNRQISKVQERITVVLFLLPAVTLITLFLVYPITRSMYISTFNWKGFGPAVDFIGLENFRRILTDNIFLKAVGNGWMIVGLSLAIQLPLALFVALIVERLPGRTFFRTIFFMPYVLSEVITAIMWLTLYNPDPRRGFLNALITLIPGAEAVEWLSNTRLVMLSIFVVLTWKFFGFHMLIYMAGLQNIPVEVEEAALIDGANKRQMMMHVTIPLLGGTIRTSTYLSILGSLQVFAIVWIMTTGGPVNASELMSTYMYRYSFVRFEMGYGSAVALIMLMISLAVSIIYMRFVMSREDYLA